LTHASNRYEEEPMPAALTAGQHMNHTGGDESYPALAGEAILAIADLLTGHGYDIRGTGRTGDSFLKVTNVPGALCDLVINANGSIEVDYRLCDPCRANPEHLISMTMTFLAAAPQGAAGRGRLRGPHGDGTVRGAACRALASMGLHIQVTPTVDQYRYEVYSAAAVTNPAMPSRGMVRIFEDNSIRWEVRLMSRAAARGGADMTEVAHTIARALD
jgi:hypothetical protein